MEDEQVQPKKRAIQAIDSNSVHKITSAQVVVDLPTAVKELLENSLDAGATTIEVRFKEYGLEGIEVIDNGSGIREDDLATVALNHHTSKISAFEDLGHLDTFGFRGEAVSSLCALSKVKLQTSTAETQPKGWDVEFDHIGNVTSKKICSRRRGTTISINSLFHTLPVRQKQFSKDYKKHFAQAQTLLQAYGLISKNLNLIVSNQPAKGPKAFQFQTQPNTNLRQNFANIFTAKASQCVMDFELDLCVSPDKVVLKTLVNPSEDHLDHTTINTRVKVEGLISKPVHGHGRASADRQFFYINGRPFAPSKVAKCVNEVYKQFNTNQYPVVLANFVLPPDAYDLNIDPNKRTVFLHSESNLVEALRAQLEIAFQPHRSTFALSQISSFPSRTSSQMQGSSTQASKRKLQKVESSQPSSDKIVQDPQPTPEAKKPRCEETEPLHTSPTDAVIEQIRVVPLFLPESLSEVALGKKPDHECSPTLDPVLPPDVPSASEPNMTQDSWLPSVLRDGSALAESSRRRTSVQMTLNTTGASWSLAKADNTKSTRRKSGRQAVDSKQNMKNRISRFARGAEVEESDHLPEEQSGPDEEEIDEGRSDEEMDEVMEEADDALTTDAQTEENFGEKIERPGRDPSSRRLSLVDDLLLQDKNLNHTLDKQSAKNNLELGLEESIQNEKIDPISLSSIPGTSVEESEANPETSPEYISQWRDEIASDHISGEVKVKCDIGRIDRIWAPRQSPSMEVEGDLSRDDGLMSAGVGESEAEATAALSRTVHQSDFANMKVIGQFNLGFIIAGLVGGEDVVIVDQHASDEKYNFERLQRETKLSGQRLLTPRVLDLPAAEELTAIEHRGLLEVNGFGISIDEEALVGQRVKLIAQPVSKSTVWGISDLEELIDLIRTSDLGNQRNVAPPRPSKTRKMFASRACRKSVMIGDSLTKAQMRSILDHMGTMEEPWACPHGRPTMRWLARCERDSKPDGREKVMNLLLKAFLE